MSYGLTNRVLVRKDARASRRPARRASCSTCRCARAITPTRTPASSTRRIRYGYATAPPSAFSPISLTARATPTTPLAIDYRLEYDPMRDADDPKLLGMSLNGSCASPTST